jgi:hypothetical protein
MLPGIQSIAQLTAITWQGKLLDASGNAINQNNVAMTFAMFVPFTLLNFLQLENKFQNN